MSGRDDLATAASTVEGVTVSPYYRQVSKAGQGFIRLDRTDYPNKFGGVDVWQVFVVLPSDIAQAEQRSDELKPLLYNALRPHMVVTSAQNQELALDSGTIPVLTITGHREQS